ncbi:MAG: YidC/Oxa1 family membrane protein insertase [Patescibacteria group bacterium]
MANLYHVLLYQPLVNALVFLYNSVAFGDLGVAIVILTIATRLLFFPLFQQMMRQQAILQKLKPEIDKIEKEFKGDPEKKGRAQMALYKEHKVNPFSMIFVLILQVIILIPLFQIFHGAPGTLAAKELYSFITAPEVFNHSFLGLIDLKAQSIILIVLASIFQLAQGYLSLAIQKNPAPGSRQMTLIAPVIIIAVLWTSPAAVWLYLLASNIFSLGQQIIVNRELTAQK